MIPTEVNRFLTKNAPEVYCDDCIATILGLSRRQQAHRVTSALATTPSFRRWKGVCSVCGKDKMVIRHA
jgi:hypothetical protein